MLSLLSDLSQQAPKAVEIISTKRYPNFNSLLVQRERIRRLELLPAKSQLEHERYHKVRDSGILLSSLKQQLTGHQVLVLHNAFPYDLPRDLKQLIVWYESGVNRELLTRAVELQLRQEELEERDVILFERSRQLTQPFVRPSFPHVNHLHLWLPRQ